MCETPYLLELFPFMRKESSASKIAYEFVEKVKSKIVFNGTCTQEDIRRALSLGEQTMFKLVTVSQADII